MINLTLLRKHPEQIIALLQAKDPAFDAQALFEKDKQLRSLLVKVEELRHTKNELAKQAKQGITEEIRSQSLNVGRQLKATEKKLKETESAFKALYFSCPNIPTTIVPKGTKKDNVLVKQVGQKTKFSFLVKNHVELGNTLGWFDFEAAAKTTGNNFAFYKGDAVRLMYALTMLMLEHNQKHGYHMVLPPYLVNATSLEVTGNFPKFKDQVYGVTEDSLYLIPTAEVSLANVYRDHIFAVEDLPTRLTAWTSCFRREAGGYGSTERGLIRIHQFEKVEIFTFCQQEQAKKEMERMLTCAEELLQKLGLCYRVMLLAAQDCSFSSACTYDLEVWMPGQNAFYEVSSASNCTDFQARRGAIRYRKAPNKKPELVYTLNASSLALPRLIVALMENYQQPDGSIELPESLKQYGIW